MPIPPYNPIPVNDANIIAFFTANPLGLTFTIKPSNDTDLITKSTVVSADYQVPSSPVSPATMETLYDPTESPTFTTAINATLSRMYAAGNVIVANSNIQNSLKGLFATYPNTLAAVKGVFTRPGTPWEYVFGVGQVPTITLLDQARNSGAGNNF